MELADIIRNALNGNTGIADIPLSEIRNIPDALNELTLHERERVVLLEEMDLSMLPRSTNVLVSALVRLEAAVKRGNCANASGAYDKYGARI
ncbi:hypothetical protein L0Y49_01645 [bacterium]|nr:hypothetical protein [bacterium]